jgi:tetratricopeptide (TPR) repeat protein
VSDVVEGRRLAAAGDVAGAAARFARAGDRDRTFRVNPDSLARTLAVDGWVGRGLALLRQDRALEAMGEFRKAVENDPGRAQELVPEITGGIATLLQTGDTTVVGPALEVYQEATAWDSTFVPTAEVLNSVCWWGSLGGHADAVAAYCEAAVRANPDAGYIVESRGVNRALRGDRAGAIEDFRVFVRWTSVDEDRARRQRWIRILERGGDPITPAEIAALRRE